MNENPFSAPSTDPAEHSTGDLVWPDASNGKRFGNMIIDLIVYYALSIVVALVIFLAGQESLLEGAAGYLVSFSVYFFYYFLMETIFGATIGKLITGTRVANDTGKATAGQIIVRTLCRFIPFEPFSFFRTEPGGWHDSISKTRVIDKRAPQLERSLYEETRAMYT